MGVGTRIKSYLAANKIRQAYLCEKTGIDRPRMSLALNEKRKLTFDDYEKIIGVLKLPAGAFIEPVEYDSEDT